MKKMLAIGLFPYLNVFQSFHLQELEHLELCYKWLNDEIFCYKWLTLYRTTNLRPYQNERICRRQLKLDEMSASSPK